MLLFAQSFSVFSIISLGYIPRSEIKGSREIVDFSLDECHEMTFQEDCFLIDSPSAEHKKFISFHSLIISNKQWQAFFFKKKKNPNMLILKMMKSCPVPKMYASVAQGELLSHATQRRSRNCFRNDFFFFFFGFFKQEVVLLNKKVFNSGVSLE